MYDVEENYLTDELPKDETIYLPLIQGSDWSLSHKASRIKPVKI